MFDLENVKAVVEIVVALVGVFAMVATMTPNKADNKLAAAALNLINLLGFNFGNAKNK